MATINATDGVALGGYDVVSYFNDGPQVGSDSITTRYEGVTFRFVSEENKAQFEANPAQFLPQYGGFCATAMSEGMQVPVNPETYLIEDGKLYLFYNANGDNTLPAWETEKDTRFPKAEQNWSDGNFAVPQG